MQNINRQTVMTAKNKHPLQSRGRRRRPSMHKAAHQYTKSARNQQRSPIPEKSQQACAGIEKRWRQIPAEYLIVHAIKNMHDAVRHTQSAQHKSENQNEESGNQQLPTPLRYIQANAFSPKKLFRPQAPARRKEGQKRRSPLPAQKILRKRETTGNKPHCQRSHRKKTLSPSSGIMSADLSKYRQQTIPERQRQEVPWRTALRQKPERSRTIGQRFHRVKQELVQYIIEQKTLHLIPSKSRCFFRSVSGQNTGQKHKCRHMEAVNPEKQRPGNGPAPAERVQKMSGHHQKNQYALEDIRLRETSFLFLHLQYLNILWRTARMLHNPIQDINFSESTSSSVQRKS